MRSIGQQIRDHAELDDRRFQSIEDKLNAVIIQNKALAGLIVAAGVAAFFGHG